jgi:hypothetical protein
MSLNSSDLTAEIRFANACNFISIKNVKITKQAWTGPEVSRKMRLPDFKKIGICRW